MRVPADRDRLILGANCDARAAGNVATFALPFAPDEWREVPRVVNVAPQEPPRFGRGTVQPFKARALHPARSPSFIFGQKVDRRSYAKRDWCLKF